MERLSIWLAQVQKARATMRQRTCTGART